jgi:hypothetical protein
MMAVDKYFINKKGRAEEHIQGTESKKTVLFPLCLAIKFGNSVSMECPDFLLNTSKGKLFIPTDSPYPKGSELLLHFYIPPKTKLLAEFKGKVIEEGEINNVCGNIIRISDFLHTKLHRLEQYLEEERHLVDEKA